MTTQQHDSSIWSHHVEAPGAPAGFTVRTCVPANPDGVEVMLERWQAGSSEPPHSHPGNDMTVVVQGQMRIQFFTRDAAGALHADGPPLTLSEGETGYVAAGASTMPSTCKTASWSMCMSGPLVSRTKAEGLEAGRGGAAASARPLSNL